MDEEMMINMITNCARMEAALRLLRSKLEAEAKEKYPMVGLYSLNDILIVAGMEPVEKAKDPSAATE